MTPRDIHVADRCREIEIALGNAKRWAVNEGGSVTQKSPIANEELGAYLANYISVLICGVVEDCGEHLFIQNIAKAADTKVQALSGKSLEKWFGNNFRNPTNKKIRDILRHFGLNYVQAYDQKVPKNSAEAQALQSIVINKNNLAHLGLSKMQLTLGDVDGYFKGIILILEALEDVLAS